MKSNSIALRKKLRLALKQNSLGKKSESTFSSLRSFSQRRILFILLDNAVNARISVTFQTSIYLSRNKSDGFLSQRPRNCIFIVQVILEISEFPFVVTLKKDGGVQLAFAALRPHPHFQL